MRIRSRSAAVLAPAAVAALVLSIAVGTTIGPSDLGTRDALAVMLARLGGPDSGLSALREGIIWDLRLPRAVLAAICGAGLALCGVVLQSLLRNPLADPFVLGVSSGASTGAVLVVLTGVGAGAVGLAGGAFIGAVVAFGLVLLLAHLTGGSTDRMILAGVAATQLFAALTSFIVYTAADAEQTRGVLFWLLGSLSTASWTDVAVCGSVVAVGVAVCLAAAGTLDAFTFGQDAAASLGVPVARVRLVLLLVTALMTAVIVSTSGAIGFVGLVLPHAARAVVGSRHRVLVPTAALLGAVFLVWVEIGSRVVIAPQELPIGVGTALVGVPAFVLLLLRRRQQGVS
ncbi:FecCD family ABC transporter permease [Nocardioides hwasunensis]|uniref:Iron chelate uptake ABC transporter family permease subunit n=1 Tax=Nocardioides hwasunensis TaxID=397258 RepID=A0ABR8MJH2_9ACTN|nr:iron chelate uptake ABC transporter family permease subunit [Nocardioides hwasunensis]MBD3916163.1 iron chelate uptake ABC transporter family permease subunit [Nocardioides hwasunensis]